MAAFIVTTPLITLIHATRGRPAKAVETMRLWNLMASDPGSVEYIFVTDPDDDAELISRSFWGPPNNFAAMMHCKCPASGSSAAAWNHGYAKSTGRLLIQVSDDFECSKAWDKLLLSRLPAGWENERLVVAINDGLRKDKLLTMAICTRAYAEYRGEFLHPGYQSVFSDNEFSARAYIGQAAGECRVIEARDITFLHRHHCVHPEVPEDETYRHQNSDKAYADGRALFGMRNPRAYGQQAHLWL